MAGSSRLQVYADLLNRFNSVISFRITKIVNNGRNKLAPSVNYSTSTQTLPAETGTEQPEDEKRINKAAEAFLQRAKEYDKFIQEQLVEFEKGKKFLARIMGKDANKFNQKQIDEAIQYLFPSGLHEPRARPMLKHPSVLFAKRKEAQFDLTGRPYHFLFYTKKPNFCQKLHDCATHLHNLNEKIRRMGPKAVHPKVPLDITGSKWLSKEQLERKTTEKILDIEYEKFIEAMELLSSHPYSYEVAAFIMEFRLVNVGKTVKWIVPKKTEISDGVYLVEIDNCRRKRCKGKVKVIHPGTGKLTINGKSLIDFFEHLHPRHEVIFPLVFTDMLGKVDIEARVAGEGTSNQAFTVRYGISRGLMAFLDEVMISKMRLAGLLQRDPRVRERDKVGQRGARRKYTWLKR